MAKKAVKIGQPRAVDRWVETNPKQHEGPAEPTIRLSIDLPESLHTRIKLDCVRQRRKMAEVLREMMEQHWPAERAA